MVKWLKQWPKIGRNGILWVKARAIFSNLVLWKWGFLIIAPARCHQGSRNFDKQKFIQKGFTWHAEYLWHIATSEDNHIMKFLDLKIGIPQKTLCMPFSYFPSLQHVETLWNMTLYVFSACLSMFHMLRICSEIASKCICKVIKVQAIERFDFHQIIFLSLSKAQLLRSPTKTS